MAFFAMSLPAQDIVGKWRSDARAEEDGTITMEMDFKSDKTFLLCIFFNMSDPESIDMTFRVVVDGTYGELNGDILPFVFNAENANIIIDKIEIMGEMAKQMENNKELETGMKDLIINQLNQSKGEFLKDLPTDGELNIIELTPTTMKVKMGDDEEDVLMMTRVP